MEDTSPGQSLPGEGLDIASMPAYWMLARIGKRVLRPGETALTRALLEALRITPADTLVEMAPGFGMTTRLILASGPGHYTGVERDQHAADIVGALLTPPRQTCRFGTADETGLSEASASVVLGKAFLSMQPDPVKAKIVAEASASCSPVPIRPS